MHIFKYMIVILYVIRNIEAALYYCEFKEREACISNFSMLKRLQLQHLTKLVEDIIPCIYIFMTMAVG